MRLEEVLRGVDVRATRGRVATADVLSVTHDSAAVRPGALFCCVRGATADGHEFAPAAVASGAVAVLGEHFVDVEVPQAVGLGTRAAPAAAAAGLYHFPSKSFS